MLGILLRTVTNPNVPLRFWNLGGPGECAMANPGWSVVLGELNRDQCRELADKLREEAYPSVLGLDGKAVWFAERAAGHGHVFAPPKLQRIHALRQAPRRPIAPGRARPVTVDDAEFFFRWSRDFIREVGLSDPVPSLEEVRVILARDQHMFWEVDGRPVSMAAITRRTPRTAAISYVYTPAEHRGRGYAGSITATVAERIFSEGRSAACLFTDLANPVSNRCYARIGFEKVCDAAYIRRIK